MVSKFISLLFCSLILATFLPAQNTVVFNGVDTTTKGAWKGVGNFNAPPASSSLVYGKDGDILPDTEASDASNPFPSYVSFGPNKTNSTTPGSSGSHLYSKHASADMVQGGPMGPEPSNTGNINYFQCNYTYGSPHAPEDPMVAWRPVVDTRQLTKWYTCAGITFFYLELTFAGVHNFEVYMVDNLNVRKQQLQVLDGDTNAILYDSGSITNFSEGIYYKWAIAGHVKVKLINIGTSDAVINGVFFDPATKVTGAPAPPTNLTGVIK